MKTISVYHNDPRSRGDYDPAARHYFARCPSRGETIKHGLGQVGPLVPFDGCSHEFELNDSEFAAWQNGRDARRRTNE